MYTRVRFVHLSVTEMLVTMTKLCISPNSCHQPADVWMAGQQGNTAQNENGQTDSQSNLSIQVGMGGQIPNNTMAD